MVTGIQSKVGEIAGNKAVSTVVLDLTNSHQKVRINAVQSESKLKNLEKEIKEKTISEMKESNHKESKVPREELLYYVVIDGKGNNISKEKVKDRIEKKSLDNNYINLSETNSVQIPPDSLYFNKNNYNTEQDKFLCYKNNLLTHPLIYEKI
jgi:hypothetical protein